MSSSIDTIKSYGYLSIVNMIFLNYLMSPEDHNNSTLPSDIYFRKMSGRNLKSPWNSCFDRFNIIL